MFWPCWILNSGDLCFWGRKPRKGCLLDLGQNLSCLLLPPDALPYQVALLVCRRGGSGARERENFHFCEQLLVWSSQELPSMSTVKLDLLFCDTKQMVKIESGGLEKGNVSCQTSWHAQEKGDEVFSTWVCVIKRSALNEWAWSKGGKNRASHLSAHTRMANWEASVLSCWTSCLVLSRNGGGRSNLPSWTGHSLERWGVWVSSPSALLQHMGSCCVCQRHLCPEDHHLPVFRQQEKSSGQKR